MIHIPPNRYVHLSCGGGDHAGIGSLILAAETARRDGRHGHWSLLGRVADGQVGAGSLEPLGSLWIDAEGVSFEELEPAS